VLTKHHAAVSTLVAGGLYVAFHSWQMAAASLISGILVDIDHTIEYVVEYGFSLDIRRFLRLVHEARYKRVFYILHSWEWFVISLAAIWTMGWPAWGLGLVAGYGQHLFLDQIGNRGELMSYSLIWRWRQGFDHGTCFPARAKDLSDSRISESQNPSK
jgi:hypothetical protein